MSTVGIVAEYNPFHNGHLYHLNKSKSLTNSKYCLVIMSPNFVQRGQLSIVDKWTRTKIALLAGADVVIELPSVYSNSSAEFFANYSVSLLNATGIVDTLCFGSENSNIDLQSTIAKILVQEPKQFKELLKLNLDKGVSFPAARADALIDYSRQVESLSHLSKDIKLAISSPNNILSIEYLKALYSLDSKIKPFSLKRSSANYHNESIEGGFSSATAIRKSIINNNWKNVENSVPSYSYSKLKDSLSNYNPEDQLNKLFNYISYRLLYSTASELKNIVGVTEGLENRIFDMFKISSSYNEFLENIKTKRFTQTTIQRLLINILLQINKDEFNDFESLTLPPYIRILGFQKNSAHLISKMKQTALSPVVLNVNKDYSQLCPLGKSMLDIEIRSTNIYSRLTNYTFQSNNYNLDLTHPLVII